MHGLLVEKNIQISVFIHVELVQSDHGRHVFFSLVAAWHTIDLRPGTVEMKQ